MGKEDTPEERTRANLFHELRGGTNPMPALRPLAEVYDVTIRFQRPQKWTVACNGVVAGEGPSLLEAAVNAAAVALAATLEEAAREQAQKESG